jgi:hypothetical protein
VGAGVIIHQQEKAVMVIKIFMLHYIFRRRKTFLLLSNEDNLIASVTAPVKTIQPRRLSK